MQFLYHEESGLEQIILNTEQNKHLKARRIKEKELLKLRNLKDEFLYFYEVLNFDKNSSTLQFLKKEKTPILKSNICLALAVIEPKDFERILPFLNELGVDKIILVYAKYSQAHFKLDLKRCERILIHSCEQCGRNYKMEFEFFENTKDFLKFYPQAIMVDFDGEKSEFLKDKLYFIGPEGGFSEGEKTLFKEKIALKNANVLKSQSAILAVASKILL